MVLLGKSWLQSSRLPWLQVLESEIGGGGGQAERTKETVCRCGVEGFWVYV